MDGKDRLYVFCEYMEPVLMGYVIHVSGCVPGVGGDPMSTLPSARTEIRGPERPLI